MTGAPRQQRTIDKEYLNADDFVASACVIRLQAKKMSTLWLELKQTPSSAYNPNVRWYHYIPTV
jgi:hypothetical protein